MRGPLKSGAWGGRPTCHPQTPPLLLTHYILKLPYFNSLSATPYLPVPPHFFPPLSTHITIVSLHHLLLPKILHSLSCVWRENMSFIQCTHYYHFTCDTSTHHWNIHKIITCKPSKSEISSSIFYYYKFLS